MARTSNKRVKVIVPSVEPAMPPPHAPLKDAVSLLQSATKHLEKTMRLLAEATLLHPELDESLGIEAQRLIGIRATLQLEIQSLESQRLRDSSYLA